MTMKELARIANVSVSAVSKAFHDADDISGQTKEHIFEIAKQYGCFGKYYKGKYHKKIIAVICHELISSFYANNVERLKASIENRGDMCVISADDFDPLKQTELIEYYASYLKVDGILVLGLQSEIKKGYETPIVAVFSNDSQTVDTVNIEFDSAFKAALERLYDLGHRNIAFIGEKRTQGKETAFLKLASQTGFERFVTIISDNRFEEAGIDGISCLAKEKIPYTAVICAYDNIALGAIKQLQKTGLSVPCDVSVIGFDNISVGKYTETALTSIDTFPNEVCSAAVELIYKKIENKYYKHKQSIIIKAELIERESIAERKL